MGKKLKFYPGLKDSKMITPAGGGEVASALPSRQRVLSLPLLLLMPFYFSEVPFVFQKYFNFSKMPYCFPEVPFGSPEMPSFYLL